MLKMGSKWVPNRIIDAEGARKPLDRHLGRYHNALGAILGALRRILSDKRSPKGGGSTPARQQRANNGAAPASGPLYREQRVQLARTSLESY